MHIRVAQESDQAAWDTFVRHHPQGLAYHQFAWKQAASTAYHLNACYLLAEENGCIVGVFPLILFRTLFFKKRYVSLPFCDIGGVLTDNAAVAARLIEQAVALARQHNVGEVEIRAQYASEEMAYYVEELQKVRMVLALPNSSEQLLSCLKSKVRSQVKKPLRDGLTAQIGGSELIDDFYSVFVRNMRDLGSPVHSAAWIRAVIQSFDQQARVVVVYTSEKIPAAAGVMLLHPAVISNPWASSLRSCKHLNPNMLLYWTMLSYASDNGFPSFDFGRSTRGGGTYKFKQQWGAKEIPLQWMEVVNHQMIPTVSTTSRLRVILENVWRRLPLDLTTLLGPHVRRHIPL